MKTNRMREGEPVRSLDVTDLILHDIQTGQLAPGVWLKQVDLEERYNCSRPDIRRALDRLALKRVVQHVQNRGYHVFEPDGEQARQVSEIRILLETGVAPKILERATPSAIETLRGLAQRFDSLLLNGTIIELYDANLIFHRTLLEISGNEELVNLISEIRLRTSSAPVSQWTTRARIQRSSAEHFEMVQAIAQGDPDRLKSVTIRHITQSDTSP